MASTLLKISMVLVAGLASYCVQATVAHEEVSHHGWGHKGGNSKGSGWGHQEVKGHGWGHQEVKGHGWGHQEVKGHGWGHQDAKSHGWGHQEAKSHGWGHQDAKSHGWGHETKGHGWETDYKFAYGVTDHHTGDVKTAQESRREGLTRGSYSLLQPDGVTRTVTYEADPWNGFKATVHNRGWAKHESQGWEHPKSHEKRKEGWSKGH